MSVSWTGLIESSLPTSCYSNTSASLHSIDTARQAYAHLHWCWPCAVKKGCIAGLHWYPTLILVGLASRTQEMRLGGAVLPAELSHFYSNTDSLTWCKGDVVPSPLRSETERAWPLQAKEQVDTKSDSLGFVCVYLIEFDLSQFFLCSSEGQRSSLWGQIFPVTAEVQIVLEPKNNQKAQSWVIHTQPEAFLMTLLTEYRKFRLT